MKLYDMTIAPSPRRVRIFLAEKNLEVETIQVDLMAGEQHTDSFKKLNPWGTVPVLELDDGSTISEITACCRYIEEVHPQPALMGTTAKEKAQIAMWDLHMESDGYQAAAATFRNTAKGFENRAATGPEPHAQIPELAERGKKQLRWFFNFLDIRLNVHEYISGKQFSIADISAFVTIEFAKWSKIIPETSLSNLKRWQDQVAARESMKA